MPRVANPPRANARPTAKHLAAESPFKSPMKISLNDDAQEKAVRLQSRQALHDIQMNQLKAAASPMRRLNNHARAASSSPKTSATYEARGKENGDGLELAVVGGTGASPVKRVPLLANFEEWMKMATDNKINATNSWNFALIDYFHDMSLLKEGDGVNFQKASCTLDGCVKIYTSRVDSVATETGKLLSGLADSGNKKRGGDEEEGDEGEEDDEEGEDGVKKRARKRVQRSSEATLAPSFAPLQLKKFELEFAVDPLFKKASADFDEGGAKGLLLNHLAIDSHGRIVFDSSDDAGDASAEGDARRRRSDALADETEGPTVREGTVEKDAGETSTQEEEVEIDMSALASRFFPDLGRLDGQDICPSLKTFDLGDPAGSTDIPFLKAADDEKNDRGRAGGVGDRSGVFLDDDNPPGFDDDDGALGGFDLPADTGFGEGGEAWARDAAIEPQMRVYDGGFENEGAMAGEDGDGVGAGAFEVNSGEYVVSLDQRRGQDEGKHEDILSYFDQALRKHWAGPEHWRIRRIKDIAKLSTPSAKTRKEKEPFEIDFNSPLESSLAEAIYTPASSNSAISLPKSQWKAKARNLLPDDKHFNSRQLLQLFLKPKARMGSRKRGGFGGRAAGLQQGGQEPAEGEMDEAYWARKEDPANAGGEDVGAEGNYDANFFQDDGLAFPGGLPDDDDEDFADAREHFSPGLDGGAGAPGPDGIAGVLAGSSQDAAYGTQLVTQSRRLRPEYVQYARVAKKVDVRRLKEEMWRGMGIGEGDEVDHPMPGSSTERLTMKQDQAAPPSPSKTPVAPVSMSEDGSLRFTSVMNNLQSVYPKQAMADISTSYCFICLLHLANEKGLQIAKEDDLMDLNIRRDMTAEITEGAD
ncbi:MAG: hypothetical protein M1832_004096 [Thelocarpon impressellum]|nr:MAG: hypothetical protein M1832_004096 [Thelocarpon impressellum]